MHAQQQGAPPRGDTLAAVVLDELDGRVAAIPDPEPRWIVALDTHARRDLLDGRDERRRRHGDRDIQRQIPTGRRKPRQRPQPRHDRSGHRLHPQLAIRDLDRARQIPAREHVGMHAPEATHHPTRGRAAGREHELGLRTGMQPAHRGRCHLHARSVTEPDERVHEHRAHAPRITIATGPQHRDARALVGQRAIDRRGGPGRDLVLGEAIDPSALEQLQRARVSGHVHRERVEQPGQQMRAQHPGLVPHRVRDPHHGVGPRFLGRDRGELGARERVAERLVEPELAQRIDQRRLHVLTLPQLGALLGPHLRRRRGAHRQALEPVVTHDLVDQIDLALEIRSEGRRRAAPARALALHVDADPREDAAHLRLGHRDAEQQLAARGPERDDGRLRQLALGDRTRHGTRTREADQQRTGLGTRTAQPVAVIDAALEAMAAVGEHAVPPRRATHARGQEPCGLEQQRGARGLDARLGTAHDARERHRSVRIGDDEVLLAQLELAIVERPHRLAGRREPHDHPALVQPPAIERVQRLPPLHHHEVRDVDDVGERTQPDAMQSHAQGQRRGPDRRALERDAEVAAAAIGGLERDQPPILGRVRQLADRRCPVTAELHREIAGDSDVAERIGTVRRDAELDHRVDDTGYRDRQRRARDRIAVEHDDAVAVGADVELDLGADHPGALDATHRTRADLHAVRELRARRREQHATAGRRHVGRPAHDRADRGAVEQLDDAQLVRAGMRRHGAHLADDHALEPVALAVHTLDLEAEPGERDRELGVGALADRDRVAEQLGQPCAGDQHGNCSKKRTSPSKSSRRSWIWCISIAMRSMPKPNAQPV